MQRAVVHLVNVSRFVVEVLLIPEGGTRPPEAVPREVCAKTTAAQPSGSQILRERSKAYAGGDHHQRLIPTLSLVEGHERFAGDVLAANGLIAAHAMKLPQLLDVKPRVRVLHQPQKLLVIFYGQKPVVHLSPLYCALPLRSLYTASCSR